MMKIFFWLLVVVNVIFLTVMKSGMLDDGPSTPAPLPLHEEKITLLNARQPAASAPALPASAPAAATAVDSACFEWGEFSGQDLDRVMKDLKKLQLGDKLSQREVDRAIGYWVYIAPLKDKAARNQKVAQIKALGVTDYFVVQEAGDWLNAISLGVFKTRESAQNFLDGLRAKGIRTAQIGEKSGKNRAVVLMVKGLDVQMSDKLTVLQKDFAGSELKRVSCH